MYRCIVGYLVQFLEPEGVCLKYAALRHYWAAFGYCYPNMGDLLKYPLALECETEDLKRYH